MHVLEKAIGLASGLCATTRDKVLGEETLLVQICNGTDQVMRATSAPRTSSGSCATAIEELHPGQAGTIRFRGDGGYCGGVEFLLGGERLLVGASASRVKGTSRFQVEFPSDAGRRLDSFFKNLSGVCMGSASGIPDRARGQLYAAACSRGDGGAFAEGVAGAGAASSSSGGTGWASQGQPSVTVLVAHAADIPAAGFGESVANLGLHYQVAAMDSVRQMWFLEHVQEVEPELLGPALFLAEHAAVRRALSKAELHDQAFAMDLMADAFLGPWPSAGALGPRAVEALRRNVELWRSGRPARLVTSGDPNYEAYVEMGRKATAELQEYADRVSALLRAAAVWAVSAVKDRAATCTELCQAQPPAPQLPETALTTRRQSVGNVAISENSDILAMHLQRSGLNPDSAGSDKSISSGTGVSLVAVVKQCMEMSAMHSLRHQRVMELLMKQLGGEAQAAVQKYCRWLPSARREYDAEGLRFRSFGAELFANLDGGVATNPERLRASLGLEAADYKAMATNSKSGEFFFFSADRRFLIKTQSDDEGVLLHGMLPAYQHHIRTMPRSLIVRFAGLFHVEVEGGKSKFFTVMTSVFDPTVKVHETFDVKGSLHKRRAKPGESIGKDQDWFDSKRRLKLREGLTRELLAAHEADAAFLMRFGVMDYSLLIGVHNGIPEGETRGVGLRGKGGGLWADGDDEVYFVGLIDFLIEFSLKKEAEHLLRAAQGHSEDASCVNPEDYARRQVKFVRESVFDVKGSPFGTLGALRISDLAGFNLVNKDRLSKSDPYVVASVGLQSDRTPVIDNNLNPVWEGCELCVPINEEHRDGYLVLSLWDAEGSRVLQGADDTLGTVSIKLDRLIHARTLEIREKLGGVSRGEVAAKVVFQATPNA